MLKDVNVVLPNEIGKIMSEREISDKEMLRLSGISLPTLVKARNGEDVRISTLKKIADSLNLSVSGLYGNSSHVHQVAHAHDSGHAEAIVNKIVVDSSEIDYLHQRIEDLTSIIETKDKLLSAQEELLALLKQFRNYD